MPEIPRRCQWALFLRNHDELTLEMVTDEERDYMYQEYASDPRMRLNLGIRRRLAPLMDNGRRQIELLHSLLFSLPGTPSSITATRSAWATISTSATATACARRCNGAATATPASPRRLRPALSAAVMDPVYGFQAVNVEAQLRGASSLLHWWTRRTIALRRRFKASGQPGDD